MNEMRISLKTYEEKTKKGQSLYSQKLHSFTNNNLKYAKIKIFNGHSLLNSIISLSHTHLPTN